MKENKKDKKEWYEQPDIEPTLQREALDLHLAGFNMAEIVQRLEVPVKAVRQWLKEQKSDVVRSPALRSADQIRLKIQETFPNYRLEEEYHIGDRLRLDFYLPELKLAFEVDGEQHRRLTPFFHKDEEAFLNAQARDKRKEELCIQQGIHLVRLPAGRIPHRDMFIAWAEEAAQAPSRQAEVTPWRMLRRQKQLEYKEQRKMVMREKRRHLKEERERNKKNNSDRSGGKRQSQ